MMCHVIHPAPPQPSSLSEKSDTVPSPAAADLPRTACTLPLASGPRPAVAIAIIHRAPPSYLRDLCAATADRGPDGYCTRLAFPGRSDAAGEGTASEFFVCTRVASRRESTLGHSIHLIAICRSRPWRRGRASDPPVRGGTGSPHGRSPAREPHARSGSRGMGGSTSASHAAYLRWRAANTAGSSARRSRRSPGSEARS